ncbi:MAG TPA: oligoendopeptidase F, partial [Clostridiaceae bacterium]|nr:oligoendopeptidase F [Clostridiaceae bacterium]
MNNRILNRNEVDEKRTWDLSAIYKTEQDYERAVERISELGETIEKDYKGNLRSSEKINRCLDFLREVNVLAGLISSCRFLAV